MLLQLQFEAFYTVNLLNVKWMVVPARNSGWKKNKLYESQFAWKKTYMNHNGDYEDRGRVRLAPMWQQSGTLLFDSCHGIDGFFVDELQI